jgi:hypothetical protein
MWQAVSGQTLSRNPTIAYELAVSRISRSPVCKLTWFSVAESMTGKLQCKYSKSERYYQNIAGGGEEPRVLLVVSRGRAAACCSPSRM